MNNSKKLYFELMRILACFFVIFDHLNGFAYGKLESWQSWNCLAWWIFSRFQVPVFFMISGALILKKSLDAKDVARRVIRMIIILLFFSALYYVVNVENQGNTFSIGEFARMVYSSIDQINDSFWFLYAYIGFLIISPILKLIVENMTSYHFKLIIVIEVAFSFLYVFEYYMTKGAVSEGAPILLGVTNFSWITQTVVFYPLVGYYLENRIDMLNVRRYILPLWILDIFTIVGSVALTYYKINVLRIIDGDYATFRWKFTYINSITIFITIKYLCATMKFTIPKWLERCILHVGECTLGIYLIHKLLIDYEIFRLKCDTILSCIGESILLFMVCFIIVRIVKFIPLVKHCI